MDGAENSAIKQFGRWLYIAGLGIAAIFLIGVAAGFTAKHLDDGGGFAILPAIVLLSVIIGVAGCAWLIKRALQATHGEDPLTHKERLNRNVVIACGLLGGIIGVGMAIVGDPTNGQGAFSNGPLPTGFAILLVLVLGVVVPLISFYWHRHIIDEQEADAYKSGALLAINAYMIGAPVWWIAWRGGFAPKPDGMVIYFATVAVLGAVWTWKKYR